MPRRSNADGADDAPLTDSQCIKGASLSAQAARRLPAREALPIYWFEAKS